MYSFESVVHDAGVISVPGILFLLAIVVGIGLAWTIRPAKLDPREPPVIHSRLPLVGHIIGMWWYGPTYYRLVKYVIFSVEFNLITVAVVFTTVKELQKTSYLTFAWTAV